MNNLQKGILIAIAAAVLAMLLFPPFHVLSTQEVLWSGYGFIFAPPDVRATVNIPMLGMQWIGVLIVGGIAYFILKDH